MHDFRMIWQPVKLEMISMVDRHCFDDCRQKFFSTTAIVLSLAGIDVPFVSVLI